MVDGVMTGGSLPLDNSAPPTLRWESWGGGECGYLCPLLILSSERPSNTNLQKYYQNVEDIKYMCPYINRTKQI